MEKINVRKLNKVSKQQIMRTTHNDWMDISRLYHSDLPRPTVTTDWCASHSPTLQGRGGRRPGWGQYDFRKIAILQTPPLREYSHTEEQREPTPTLPKGGSISRRGAEFFWGLRVFLSQWVLLSCRSLSEFRESATVGRSLFPPFPSLRPRAAPSVPSVPLCEIRYRPHPWPLPSRGGERLARRKHE